MMKKRAMFAAAAALLTAVTAYSHDYWFEPEAFFAPAGGSARVRLYVGEGLKIRRCRDCADADWESFWAAYSFGLK